MNPVRVFIGYDTREVEAYEVARHSLLQNASVPVCVIPLKLEANQQWGLLKRRWSIRQNRMWDRVSNAACSTEFALSRFLVPHLTQSGWSLFVDSDVVFTRDVAELFALADRSKAVMVVKHDLLPEEGMKMDSQLQQSYPRKNWSSVMLINADHHGHKRLTLEELNEVPGRDLHAFAWLWDNEIGALPGCWNWLVGVQEQPENVGIAHFTLGGPWLTDWRGSPYDELWRSYANRATAR